MPTITRLERSFEYNGITIPDPNPSLSIREVQDILSHQYPELANAKPRTETKGEKSTITFTVAAGTKG